MDGREKRHGGQRMRRSMSTDWPVRIEVLAAMPARIDQAPSTWLARRR